MVADTKPSAVVATNLSNLFAVVQQLYLYLIDIIRVHGILYHLQITSSGYLHIARKGVRYSLFNVYIKDMIIAELALQYKHLAGLPVKIRSLADDEQRIVRYMGCEQYPM